MTDPPGYFALPADEEKKKPKNDNNYDSSRYLAKKLQISRCLVVE
jgi:hypothetical protein